MALLETWTGPFSDFRMCLRAFSSLLNGCGIKHKLCGYGDSTARKFELSNCSLQIYDFIFGAIHAETTLAEAKIDDYYQD